MQQIGRYEVLSTLGQGGMGAVLEVRPAGGSERFALKLLTEPDPEGLERFRREAAILQFLGRHPAIVKLRDLGDDRGRPFFVMDLVGGGTLSDRLKDGLPARDVAAILRDVARALHFAHEAGVVHRDVKPSNVLLHEDGRPVLSDFGLARPLDAQKLTKTGTVMGTIEFMAPEQVDAGKAIDRRADVYALGAILYRALAGVAPFEGAEAAVYKKILFDPPRAPSRVRAGVDPALEAICLKALAKAPGDRHPTAEAFALDLERWLAGEPLVFARASGALKSRTRAVALGVVTALAVAGFGLFLRERSASRAAQLELSEREQALAASKEALSDRERSLARATSDAAMLRRSVLEEAIALTTAGAPLPEPTLRELEADPGAEATARWLEVFRSMSGVRSGDRAARGKAAKALVEAARHERSPERAVALVERAYEIDLATVAEQEAQRQDLARLLKERALDALKNRGGDAAAVREARDRLVRARLLSPRDPWPDAGTALKEVAASGRSEVRVAARPWSTSMHALDGLVDECLTRGPKGSTRPLQRLLQEGKLDFHQNMTVYFDATAEWLLWRPDVSYLWRKLGEFAMRLERLPEVVRACEIARERDAKDLDSSFVLGQAYLKSGETRQAVAAFQGARRGEDFWGLRMLAEALVRSDAPGDLTEALKTISILAKMAAETEKEENRRERELYVWNLKGLAAERQGNTVDAENWRRRVREQAGF